MPGKPRFQHSRIHSRSRRTNSSMQFASSALNVIHNDEIYLVLVRQGRSLISDMRPNFNRQMWKIKSKHYMKLSYIVAMQNPKI